MGAPEVFHAPLGSMHYVSEVFLNVLCSYTLSFNFVELQIQSDSSTQGLNLRRKMPHLMSLKF